MIGPTSADSMYTITLHQPWASLIALGIKTVETRSWPAPARLVGQTIAVHAGKPIIRQLDLRSEMTSTPASCQQTTSRRPQAS